MKKLIIFILFIVILIAVFLIYVSETISDNDVSIIIRPASAGFLLPKGN